MVSVGSNASHAHRSLQGTQLEGRGQAQVSDRRKRCFTVKSFQGNNQQGDRAVTVRFSTHFQAEFGEKLKVVGSTPLLGEWDVTAAPDMQWTDGHVWVTDLELPKNEAFEYKVVHVSASSVHWEQSQNRVFVPLPEVAPPDAAALAVNLAFNNPGLTTIEPISLGEAEESGSRSSPAGNPEEQGLPGDLTAELAAAANLQEASTTAATSAAAILAPVAPAKAIEAVPQSPEVSNGRSPALGEPARAAAEKRLLAASLVEAAPVSAATMEVAVPRGGTQGPITNAEVETGVAVVPDAEGPGEELKKAAVPTPASLLGTAALVGVAGLVATALAVDLTDAALVGAIVATGATLSGDKETRGDAAKAAATALNVGLNITESVARKFGLKSHVEMREEARARAEAAAKERSPPPTPEE